MSLVTPAATSGGLIPRRGNECRRESLSQRREQLDYAGARAAGLPIGSGEIESGHRHVIQQRLKLAGGWWKESNAQAMLSLRVARANQLWDPYWLHLNPTHN